MRVLAWSAALLLCAACGQKSEHPELAPSCDPAVMTCRTTVPGSGSGTQAGSIDGSAGADSVAGGVLDFSGQVLLFNDDYFDQGAAYAGTATVSAAGEGNERVSATYDGKVFSLPKVLEAPVNWFLVEPQGVGVVPTLDAVATRNPPSTELRLGLAGTDAVDGIFLNSGTDRSLERAQLVVHVVDSQLRSVPGIRASVSATAEITEYRLAGAWVPDDGATTKTDDTGMLFFGNVAAGSTLTKATVSLSGNTTSHIDVELKVGVLTLVNAIVTGK
jgi:hypothetical protein